MLPDGFQINAKVVCFHFKTLVFKKQATWLCFQAQTEVISSPWSSFVAPVTEKYENEVPFLFFSFQYDSKLIMKEMVKNPFEHIWWWSAALIPRAS